MVDNYFEGHGAVLPTPPDYFLQRIKDYDHMLVIFASIVRFGSYVIARRREKSAGLTGSSLAAFTNPDTQLCVAMGWIPVCTFAQTGTSWSPDMIIAKLKARDIWAHGGADKVADLLEQQEDAEKAATQKQTREDLWNRSGDGWRTYQARTGASSIRFHGEVKLSAKKAAVSQPSPLEAQQDGQHSAATVGGEVQ